MKKENNNATSDNPTDAKTQWKVLCCSWGCEENQKGNDHPATYLLKGCDMPVCDDVRDFLTTPHKVETTECSKAFIDPGLPKRSFRKITAQNS